MIIHMFLSIFTLKDYIIFTRQKNTSSIDLFGLETLQPQAPSSMSNNGMKVNSFNGMMPQQNRNNNNNAFDPFGSLSNPSSFPRGPPAAQGKRF